MLIHKFKYFESIDIVNIEYNPIFLTEWNDVLSKYNNYATLLQNFFDSIENDLHMLSATGYTISKIDDNLSRDERKFGMNLKHNLLEKLEEFIQSFRDGKAIEEDYKYSPTTAILIKDGEQTTRVNLQEVIYTTTYKKLTAYFTTIWQKWNYLEMIYLDFFKVVNHEIVENKVDMIHSVQEILEANKLKMANRVMPTLPTLN